MEQTIPDSPSPPAQRGGKFNVNFDDERNIESPDSVDGSVFKKKKVKKAKPVGGFSGDVETIGELTMSTKQRPASSFRVNSDQESLIHHVVGGKTSNKSTTELQKEIEFLQRQVETFKEQRWKGPTVDDTVRRLLWGKPCALDFYKSKEDKKLLLDAALKTLDGNCITKVLVFIKSTSRIGILVKIVEDQPMAINHYASYLRQNLEFEELIRFYEMVGDKEAAGMVMYETCRRNGNTHTIQRLDECEMFFKRYPDLSPNVPVIQEYVTLLKRQIKINNHMISNQIASSAAPVLYHSLITTLYYCCRYCYDDKGELGHLSTNTKNFTKLQGTVKELFNSKSSPCNPRLLKTDFKLSDQQYVFMAIKACASRRDWKSIEDLLTVKVMFGSKLKSPIGFKNIVKLVSNAGAPDEVKSKYLNEVTDIEDKLKLAIDYKMHSTAINILCQLKDQKRLESYVSRVPPKSQYRQMIQDKLRILTQRK